MVQPDSDQPKRPVSWQQIDEVVEAVAKEIPERYSSIYGIPRGGLIPATMLSHLLDIDMVVEEDGVDEDTLIVDDISDSGETLEGFMEGKENDVATLYVRKGTRYFPDYHAYFLENDDWLVFPWED